MRITVYISSYIIWFASWDSNLAPTVWAVFEKFSDTAFFNRKTVLDGDNDRCPGYSNMCRGYMVRKGRGAYNERRQLWDSKVTSKSHRSA